MGNFILVMKSNTDEIIPIHDTNKYFWDRIPDKRVMDLSSDKAKMQTYAVNEDALDKLDDQYFTSILKPVFVGALMRENRHINLDIRSVELTTEEK